MLSSRTRRNCDGKSGRGYAVGDMKTPYWEVLRRVTVYDSPWVRIHRDDIRLPDGSMINGHHVVDVPRPAVGIIPVGGDGRVLLIEHYRFITGTTGWEVPAGGIDPNENTELAAARELLEETGHAAAAFQYLGQYYPSNGLSNQTFHVYIGNGVARCGEICDTNEVSRAAWFTLTEVAEMLRANAIRDGSSSGLKLAKPNGKGLRT
jgi:8-oxo-dGTP pyrophosphatase MutT (NUDIX family)